MKEMIIVNNDGKCEGCDMCYHVQYGGYYCKASKDKLIGNKEDAQKKPEWCPANTIPIKKQKNKMLCSFIAEVCENKGHNSCIDEILKGE